MRNDIGEIVFAEVVDERRLEGGIEAAERAAFGFASKDGASALSGSVGQSGQFFDQFSGGSDDLAVPEGERGPPLVPPSLQVARLGRPAQFICERLLRVGDVKHGVAIVPTQNFQNGQVGRAFRVLGEVGERNPTIIFLTVGGNEQEVVKLPGPLAGLPGTGALLQDEMAEDAP